MYAGVFFWLLQWGANSSSYVTSPVLICYLSTNSGREVSLWLIASLKSHKAVWHSQDANPSQLGYLWWGGNLKGRQAAVAGRKEEKKKSMSNWAVVCEPRCQHPRGSRARTRSSSRLTRPTKPWARQLAGAPVDSTFLYQWLFLPPFLLVRSVLTSLKIPLLACQSRAHYSAIMVFQCSCNWLCVQAQLCSVLLLHSNVCDFTNYPCRK